MALKLRARNVRSKHMDLQHVGAQLISTLNHEIETEVPGHALSLELGPRHQLVQHYVRKTWLSGWFDLLVRSSDGRWFYSCSRCAREMKDLAFSGRWTRWYDWWWWDTHRLWIRRIERLEEGGGAKIVLSGGLGGRGASTGKSVGDTGCRTSLGGWSLLLGYRVLISRLFLVKHLLPPSFTIQYESGCWSLHWIYSGFYSGEPSSTNRIGSSRAQLVHKEHGLRCAVLRYATLLFWV